MPLSVSIFADAPSRYERFEHHFLAQAFLQEKVEEVSEKSGESIKVRKGDERNLSLVVALSYAKGLKTFAAVSRLCVLGYGEDAQVLLRSNINLLINLKYILDDPNPVQRANEFLASTYRNRETFFRLAYGENDMPYPPPVPPDMLTVYAKAWSDVTLETRADRAKLKDFYYTKGYRFFSSMEHSEAFALNEYLEQWNEVGPRFRAESDNGISLALLWNFRIMKDLLSLFLRYYRIDRKDVEDALDRKFIELCKFDSEKCQ